MNKIKWVYVHINFRGGLIKTVANDSMGSRSSTMSKNTSYVPNEWFVIFKWMALNIYVGGGR